MNDDLNIGKKGKWNGIIISVLYLGQNGYAVVDVEIDNKESIIAEGNIEYAKKGDAITLNGEVVFNTKYQRKQIKVTSSEIKTDAQGRAAVLFLQAAIAGFGEKTARKIVEKYGSDFDSFMFDEKKMTAISGITANNFKKIKKSYIEKKQLYPLFKAVNGEMTLAQAEQIYKKYGEDAADVLKKNPYQLTYDLSGIGFLRADKLALKAGVSSDSDDRILAAIIYCLRNNETKSGSSYILMSSLCEQVTELIFNKSQYMIIFYQDVLNTSGIPDDLSEWEALTLSEIISNHAVKLNNAINKWDMDLTRDKFVKEFKLTQDEIDTLDIYYKKRLRLKGKLERIVSENAYNAGVKSIDEIITELSRAKNFGVQMVTEKLGADQTLVYIAETYKAECEVALKIVDLASKAPLFKFEDEYVDKIIQETEKEELNWLKIEDAKKPVMQRKCPNKYSFGEDQKQAIKKSLTNRFSVITGGPGRGKTTIIKTVIKAVKLKKTDANIILLAPTGKAAKRMTEATGIQAHTIHRFMKNKSIQVDLKTIVFVDEFSMTDLFLFKWLLTKISNCQIVLIGDKDQLASVGAGKCLEDIIESGVIPVTFLTTCYRNDGSILKNINTVNAGGRLQEIETDNHFKTIWMTDKEKCIKEVIDIYVNNLSVYGASNMMVLAAMNDTVNRLNKSIQQRVNPKAPNKIDIQAGANVFRINDRVMQTSNDYDIKYICDGEPGTGIFNGETGVISNISEKYDEETGFLKTIIEVTFDDGKIALYKDKFQWNKLTLAYAITYHKSQGSEAKFLICTLFTSDFILLQKKVLYTGISRGKNLVYMVGHAKAFQMAIYNYSGKNGIRYSRLKEKLQELAENKII